MINSYALFNNHNENNTLYILFSDDKVDNELTCKNVILLYKDKTLVGYKIPNFIRYAKIKYSGIIFYPNKILISVINSILANLNLEQLAIKDKSGYLIKKNDSKVGVYAEPGTFLRDGSISKGRFCTYFDLYIDNDNPDSYIEIEDETLIGKDFFSSKEF